MPICEEPVDRVFAGLQAIYRSLERTGALGSFDFFVLSDSADPRTCGERGGGVARAGAARVDGFGRIFYRRRRVRVEAQERQRRRLLPALGADATAT